ncbi:MAG: gliding-motility protein MglA [Myxococcota bacterium]
MATFHSSRREVRVKLVYYGPGLSGKTTNLVRLHEVYPDTQRGKLVKLDTDQERTLFFDYFPASLGSLRGFNIAVDFFTVPGQSYYNVTRRTVLAGADGVVFVADSDPRREEANVVAHANFLENLGRAGLDPGQIAIVYQWNKRDLPNALPVRTLQAQLNRGGAPAVEASAFRNEGVRETERLVLSTTLKLLRNELSQYEDAK